MPTGEPAILTLDGLDKLLRALAARGFRVIGPTVRDQAIVIDDISSITDLPKGWTDEQDGGYYRLIRSNDEALFGFAVGAHSWKRFLHPPMLRLWMAEREGKDLRFTRDPDVPDRFAFIGVRACDLAAIAIQDRVFLGGSYVDPHYKARRESAFIVAINCATAGGTCFCASMNTGPGVSSGFDLALTELFEGDEHRFLIEAGSDAGRRVLGELPQRAATQEEVAAAEQIVKATAAAMGRQMRSDDVHELLMENLDHPRWDNVAERCLTCANCTMVCPTCFCTSVEDHSALDGSRAERTQRWDSCFTMDFSYIHGGSVRASPHSRYRQWMTHKLATWVDQFGTSGCVGCGRCITWCPVGIDITEEVHAIRESEGN
ncbi:MAG: 4Fe-4S dicluster domain-containing protein [Hyphomicrobium sp.]|uniref:4Fe-4S dicluster domain-containing protein n=1 Tax=Hyphomicrobium sp. TaxID=82 RepID=UPI0013272D26|nr:4Fe-4S dicluster domain-containing protein [Hyphomicrobium sp.]KAB2943484.1 MAG: sulfite reductase subunit A [Hyphomicrobium sp.]MBZ0210729.1 4Fe-4S dicluster domain-containing protein [Hyphomicrobium sp.]